MSKLLPRVALSAVALAAAGLAQAAATITIINGNAAGVGFNDPTPVAPVGGNPGLTLGQQRQNVFVAVAQKWGATIDSAVEIKVFATFEPLSCSATGAVLASAGAWTVWRDFANAPIAGTWHSAALANKRSGVDLDPGDPMDPDIRTQLGVDIATRANINLGAPGCFTGSPFYLGLDNNAPAGTVDLFSTMLHELGHGLGFQAFTSSSTGARIVDDANGLPYPSQWERFMLDATQNKTWLDMNDAERVASAINFRRLAWTGANVTAGAPSVLSAGSPTLAVNAPRTPAATGSYPIGNAAFGAALSSPGVTAQLMTFVNQPASLGQACEPFNAQNALAANNNIMLIDRGGCAFVIKVKNAQNAGAKGVIIVNNAAGSPPAMGGSDPTITIPTVSVSNTDGALLRTALAFRSRTTSGVTATIGVNLAQLAGADTSGRVLLFTPNPVQPGSSVSHYDTSATPSLIMEPAITPGLAHEVTPPFDLTMPLFKDIGW